MKRLPRFCKFCGRKLMYRADNGSENNGWNRLEQSSFNEFTGKRIGPKYSYEVNLFCPEWNDFWHTIPRPRYSPTGHTSEYFKTHKMLDLKRYGITPTVFRKEEDIINGMPRDLYMERYFRSKKKSWVNRLGL